MKVQTGEKANPIYTKGTKTEITIFAEDLVDGVTIKIPGYKTPGGRSVQLSFKSNSNSRTLYVRLDKHYSRYSKKPQK